MRRDSSTELSVTSLGDGLVNEPNARGSDDVVPPTTGVIMLTEAPIVDIVPCECVSSWWWRAATEFFNFALRAL